MTIREQIALSRHLLLLDYSPTSRVAFAYYPITKSTGSFGSRGTLILGDVPTVDSQ